jgi:hypothetical protein
MQTALETIAIAFVASGIVWFVAVHVLTFAREIRERRKRRR